MRPRLHPATSKTTLDHARAAWLAGGTDGWSAYKRCVCGLEAEIKRQRTDRPRSTRRARRPRGRA
ncbi:hypothetical protein [Rubrivirga sp.]|uniref:hypothetical protein n=1 Tax=Rubrivirga sp. TaxID=1885344 RepID=UPI003C77C86C